MRLALGKPRRRIVEATYPDGTTFELVKVKLLPGLERWKYHPRGSFAFPLSAAKAAAIAEGATISSRLV